MFKDKLKKIERKIEVVDDILNGEHGLAGLMEHYEWSQGWHETNGSESDVMEYVEKIDVLKECADVIGEALEKYIAESVVK